MKYIVAFILFSLTLHGSTGYDAQDRLVKVQTPTDTTTYTYDANNNRISQTINNQTTSYLVDTNTPYANVITQSKDGVKTSYTYGNDLLNDNEHYFLTDALGSTRALSDASGTITDTYSYTPYGELSNHTGSSQNNFLFAGEQFDSQTGEYYLRARYYDPSQARFISRDTYDGTLTNPITQNHYAYANANPMMYTDPSGRMSMMSLSSSMSIMSTITNSFIMRTAGQSNLFVPVAISAYHMRIGMQLRVEAINSIVFSLYHTQLYHIPNSNLGSQQTPMELAYKKYYYSIKLIQMSGLFAESMNEGMGNIWDYVGFANAITDYSRAKNIAGAYQNITGILTAKQYELTKIGNNLSWLRQNSSSITDTIQDMNGLIIQLIAEE